MAIDILIAEDEPSILESLDFILRRAGWTISAVTDGDAALEAVRRLQAAHAGARCDAAQAQRLRRAQADPGRCRTREHLPVLILTAKGQQQDRRIAEELGADVFVTKPYANAEVVGAVRQLLGEDGRIGVRLDGRHAGADRCSARC